MAGPRFAFSIAATDGHSRTGTIAMRRGEIRTPAFMPVGTAATVKAMSPKACAATGAPTSSWAITYHLMLVPAPSGSRVGRPSRVHGLGAADLTDSAAIM